MTFKLLPAILVAAWLPAMASAVTAPASPLVATAITTATPALQEIPADYFAWVSIDPDSLFRLKPGATLALDLPGIGRLQATFDRLESVDGAGKVIQWQGHRTGHPEDRIVFVRGLYGAMGGMIDLGEARLLIGYANGDYAVYLAGAETAPLSTGLPQILNLVDMGNITERGKPAAVAFPVEVDLASLTETPVGSEMQLSLPGAGEFTVVHDNTLAGDLGASTFVGYLKDYGNDFRVMITSSPAGSQGSVLTPYGEYRLQISGDQTWVVDVKGSGLDQWVPDHNDGIGQPVVHTDTLEPPMAGGMISGGQVATAKGATTSGTGSTTVSAQTDAAGITQIDVLVLYSPGLVSRLGTDQALARIQHLVALTNQAYQDSGVNITLRLAQAVRIDGLSDTSNNNTTLSDLAAGRGVFSQVPALRDQYGADLVTVIRPFHMNAQGQSCGVGFVGSYGGSSMSLFANYAYSVVSDGTDMEGQGYYCTDYTFAHELGHNMGSMHDRATTISQGGGTGAYPYSFGYGQSGLFGTIMSYIGPTIGKFSNPRLNNCSGSLSCGVDANNSYAADNSQSLNNTSAAVSAFRNIATSQPTYVYISGVASYKRKALAGVSISGTGAECLPSANNGFYVCRVLQGWSGTLTAARAGYYFNPASRTYASLTASQGNQNWSASIVRTSMAKPARK